ncbi:MAG TPA: DUF6438 domain-containing protein [Pyrinomonadaceae bacterium]|nr:DUF6438 domain-containing protein [Pyrinomonadaceae bacterium]
MKPSFVGLLFCLCFSILVTLTPLAFALQETSGLENLSDTDLKDFKITLERTPCYGNCPAYKLTVFGDGRVQYEGLKYVKTIGKKESLIKPGEVREIVSAALEAKYFTLDSYAMDNCTCTQCTDMPAANTEISIKGRSHKVGHDFGCRCAPKELWNLEETIDRVAGSLKWTGDVSKSGPMGTTCFNPRP